jgi:ABC-type transport system substrate-binding protein
LSGATAAHAEKVLRYSFEDAETGFDPAQITDVFSRMVTTNIFDAPLRHAYHGDGAVEINTLAEMPTISADSTTFTFRLKPGIYFAPDPAFNGQKRELVAEDYVYSFKRYYDPHWRSQIYGGLEAFGITSLEKLRADAIKTGHFDYGTPIEGIHAIDRYTWQIKLSAPAPRFASDEYYDASQMGAVAREVVEKYGDNIMEHPVGTGAYMLADWVRSSKIVLVKNPNYREELFAAHYAASDAAGQRYAKAHIGQRMPFVDRIEISIIQESQPRWLSFLNGETDVLPWVPSDLASLAYPGNKLAPNLAKKHIEVQRTALVRDSFLVFNMEDPVVGGYSAEKVALRRAIGLGMDIPTIISNIFKYQAIPAQGMFYPHQLGYDPDMKSEMGTYDPARANAILDTYGYLPRHGGPWRDLPDGTPFTLTYLDAPTQRDRNLTEVMKKCMDALGIRIVIKTQLWPENLKAAQTGNFQLWVLGNSSTSTDPADDLKQLYGPAKGGENLARFQLAEYDSLFTRQNQLPNGPERLALLGKLRDLANAYEPSKYAWHQVGISLWYPWVENYYFDPLLDDWWRYVDIDETAQRPYL